VSSRVAPRRHAAKLLSAVLPLAAILALSMVSGAGAASSSAPATFKATPAPTGSVDGFTPAVSPISKSISTVIVQLSGDPVTVADANSKDAGGPGLSDAQKSSLKAQLQSQQAPVEQAVQQDGGKVLASYQDAYNGIAVQIPASKVASLSSLSGVANVYPSRNYTFSDDPGVTLVQGPQTWGGTPGFTGKGMKIADIDTGIDYTHADFGGPGTIAAWNQAKSQSTADPTLPTVCMTPQLTPCFGPNAPKVKGGTDLVGDNYDAGSSDPAKNTPQPDPNPLDCNSHGTHTAGTAAGFGVLANGNTFTGPYNASTISGNQWNVGPGVAPEADIYSVRVFGCSGSASDAVIIQGIEWAVDHHMDAINMSLGAPFGTTDSPSAAAATDAAKDGVIVVSSSGNGGNVPYLTGSPGTAADTLSAAANDPTQSFPAANLSFSNGSSLTAIDANGAAIPSGSFPVKIIPPTAHDASLGSTDTGPNGISLGCSVADDTASGPVTGEVIVVERGVCARVAKAIFAQQAGAAGVIMVNNSSAFPPFEGTITNDPDAPGPPLFGGFQYQVTIPFLGVPGATVPSTSAAAATLRAANGGTVSMTATTLANPTYLALASFSSGGPRTGDSGLKPEVTAPGVSIVSAGMGTGNGPLVDSGTSMAAPHTTGTALLVKQAHPDWRRVANWNAAIANTATPSGVAGYNTLNAGVGLVQAFNATHTQVVALGTHDGTSLDFGLYQDTKDFQGSQTITLHNFGSQAATFNVADNLDQGSPHSVAVSPSTVTVPPRGGTANVQVALNVPIATAGTASLYPTLPSVAGLVTFTPSDASQNSNISLNMPYLLVPEASSNMQLSGITTGTFNPKSGQTSVTAPLTVTNPNGAADTFADTFAWGLKGDRDPSLGSADLLDAGVQSFPTGNANTSEVVFAINTSKHWSNPAEDEFDVSIDVNGDGKADFDVLGIDDGIVTGNPNGANGEDVVAVINDNTGSGSIRFLAGAAFNGSTIELPVLFSQLPGISASTPITYTVASVSQNSSAVDTLPGSASYNLFTPAIVNNGEDQVHPNGTATDPTTVNETQWAKTPQLGLLVFDQDDTAGLNKNEAQTIRLGINPK